MTQELDPGLFTRGRRTTSIQVRIDQFVKLLRRAIGAADPAAMQLRGNGSAAGRRAPRGQSVPPRRGSEAPWSWCPRIPAVPKDDSMAERDWDLYAFVTRTGTPGARGHRGPAGAGSCPVQAMTGRADGDAVIAWLARSRGARGRSGCGASRGAGSTRSRWPCGPRRRTRCGRSSPWRRPTALQGRRPLRRRHDAPRQYAIMIDLLNALSPAPEFCLRRGDAHAPVDGAVVCSACAGATASSGARLARARVRTAPRPACAGSAAGTTATATARRACSSTAAPVRRSSAWNHTWPHDAVPGPGSNGGETAVVGPLAEGRGQRD